MAKSNRHSLRAQRTKTRVPTALSVILSVLILSLGVAFYQTNGFGLLGLRVRDSLEDYQWGELKLLADMIASAESDEEGLQIACRYHLCREDGTLDPADTKPMEFGDGSKPQNLRIIGFRHDVSAYSGKPVGITFCFTGSVGESVANLIPEDGNNLEGSWDNSTLRAYASSCLTEPKRYEDKIPFELGRIMPKVLKHTWKNDQVIETQDYLFALSCEEVYGRPSNRDETNAFLPPDGSEEGQYKYFAENGPLIVDDPDSSISYWLRSRPITNPASYFAVSESGILESLPSEEVKDVVLGFCL